MSKELKRLDKRRPVHKSMGRAHLSAGDAVIVGMAFLLLIGRTSGCKVEFASMFACPGTDSASEMVGFCL